MKKIFTLFITVIIAVCLSACSSVAKVDIDYGSSNIYSQSDMDSAIKFIKNEFSTWKGCELHSIRYSSDKYNNEENIKWLNELGDGNTKFTQCIKFVSDFRSPKSGGDAWEADSEYTDWQWWLARTDGGEWILMDWGY